MHRCFDAFAEQVRMSIAGADGKHSINHGSSGKGRGGARGGGGGLGRALVWELLVNCESVADLKTSTPAVREGLGGIGVEWGEA